MTGDKVRGELIAKGKAPLCLKSRQQCRGCFGWRNMINAAQADPAWRDHPIRCLVTGLTINYSGPGQTAE